MDLLLVLDAPDTGLRLAVCTASLLAREASERHQLAPGSAAALAQALAGALLLTAAERENARVDIQLECGGPLRGLLVDADATGAVRGLVRVNDLGLDGGRVAGRAFAGPAPRALRRFDARPLLATGLDEKAGLLSVLRAQPGSDALHRAAFPFAGADLGAALTLFLRSDRAGGGELSLEVLHGQGEPLAAVAGALLWPALPDSGDDADRARSLGKPLRQAALHQAMSRSEGANAHALAQELSRELSLGPLRLATEVRPRFACRCSRERVVRALGTLGKAELEDMAGRDGGASATCDFCMASYRISAAELLELAGGGLQPS